MKNVVFGVVMLCMAIPSFACDICGCASGGSSMGILPRFQQSFVGIRAQSQDFYSKPHNAQGEQYASSHEQFRSFEIWGRYNVHKRIQLFGFLPYRFNLRETGGKTLRTQGVGDLQFLLNYVILNTPMSSLSATRHSMQIGGGIKLPLGQSDLVKDGLFVHQNMQIGTGSYDLPLNLIYTMRHKKNGLNAEINYRINGENRLSYAFGNKFSSTFRYLRWIEKKAVTFLPQAGFNAEQADIDRQSKLSVEYTGGHALSATAGCDAYFRKIALGLQLSQPLYQQLGNGYTRGKTRISANIIYLFKRQQ